MSADKHQWTCGALFSGIGGFCHGFESAGFSTLWAIDNDPEAVETYKLNFPGNEVLCKDICEINNLDDPMAPVDMLHAGFPCQSFSAAGNRRGFEDPRGRLFFEIVKFVKKLGSDKPKIIVLENAPNLQIGAGGVWFDTIRIELQRLGYWFGPNNTAIIDVRVHAGLPQRRERLFMVATCRKAFGYNPPLEVETADTVVPLDDLLDIGRAGNEGYFLPEDSKYTEILDKALEAAPKETATQLIQFRRMQVRLQPPGVCPTLTANMGGGGHNVPFVRDSGRLRKLTEKECLRLQGFDDNWLWAKMAQSARYRLIGNSVSPPIAERLGNFLQQMFQNSVHDV